MLMKNAENLNNIPDCSTVDGAAERANIMRQREAVQRLDVLVNGCKGLKLGNEV